MLQSDAGSLESAAAELSKAASLLVSIERHIISMQQDGVSSVHAVWGSFWCPHKTCLAMWSFKRHEDGTCCHMVNSLDQLVLVRQITELSWKQVSLGGCLVISQTLST